MQKRIDVIVVHFFYIQRNASCHILGIQLSLYFILHLHLLGIFPSKQKRRTPTKNIKTYMIVICVCPIYHSCCAHFFFLDVISLNLFHLNTKIPEHLEFRCLFLCQSLLLLPVFCMPLTNWTHVFSPSLVKVNLWIWIERFWYSDESFEAGYFMICFNLSTVLTSNWLICGRLLLHWIYTASDLPSNKLYRHQIRYWKCFVFDASKRIISWHGVMRQHYSVQYQDRTKNTENFGLMSA